MKQCPRCNEVYSPQDQFCVNDGSSLIGVENRNYEVETMVRGTPFVVNLEEQDKAESNRARTQRQIPTDQPPKNEAKSAPGRTFELLLTGIAIGGVLVLATVFTMNLLKPDPVAEPGITSANKTSFKNTNIVNPVAENANGTSTNYDVSPIVPKESKKSKITEKQETEKDNETAYPDPKKLFKKGYNGRVIMMNAIIRASPSIYAPEIGVISYEEPIKIGKSAGGNNPWYRVTTTGGTTGWMHGNTIEFVR